MNRWQRRFRRTLFLLVIAWLLFTIAYVFHPEAYRHLLPRDLAAETVSHAWLYTLTILVSLATMFTLPFIALFNLLMALVTAHKPRSKKQNSDLQ